MELVKERGKERHHAAAERQDVGNHGDGASPSAHLRPPCRHDGGCGRGSGRLHGVDGYARRPCERTRGAPTDAP